MGHQGVRPGLYCLDRQQLVFRDGHPDGLGQPVEEQGPEELGVGLAGWAELPHLGQQHGRPLAA